MVRLKIRNGENDIRRISVPKEVEYAQFIGQLRKLLTVPKNEDIVVKYFDDEGDQITISTDIELHEALSNCVKEPLQFIILRKAATGEQALFEEFESNILLSSLQSSVRNSIIVKDDQLQEEKMRVDEEMRKAEELMLRMKLEEQLEEENKKMKEEKIICEARIREEKLLVEETNKKLEEEVRIRNEQEEKRKEEERKRNENKNISKPYCWGEFKARNGRRVLLDLSSESLTKFNVKPFERVEAPSGYGTIVGTDQELGFLWVQLDKDMNSGVSYWDDVKDYDSMICKGIIPLEIPATADQVPKVLLPISNPFDRTYDDIKDPKERAMLEKALQESLLEIKRKEIQSFYGKK